MAEGLWTAVGLSSDLEPGAVAGVIVEGAEWALWRGMSGKARFWEDRCPHRGMRLSLGFVRGDRLGCLHHGWQYDEAGRCRYIPAHPELEPPATIGIPSWRVAESGGLIWAAPGAPNVEAPPFAEGLPVRSLYLDAPLADARQALSDMATKIADAAGGDLRAGWRHAADRRPNRRRSALHIAILTPVSGPPQARQKRHARWAERLRLAVEAGR